ncbi:hypothetical protein Ahy_B09g095221 [Arachis hypogaea]|uniref:Uncharacterized protein n=1 Tax=Arachis hypogaea TaxID=3818 RepID=A0A444XDE0_ARAHY|nr:hypothetical protein Ahy_B09g095221 [Arachis hypogaea]
MVVEDHADLQIRGCRADIRNPIRKGCGSDRIRWIRWIRSDQFMDRIISAIFGSDADIYRGSADTIRSMNAPIWKGTDAIESIFLDMTQTTDLYISSNAFRKMPNLRTFYLMRNLDLDAMHAPKFLEYANLGVADPEDG